jgi:beta-lactamase regulating signal transducer with metallopeptidase domain
MRSCKSARKRKSKTKPPLRRNAQVRVFRVCLAVQVSGGALCAFVLLNVRAMLRRNKRESNYRQKANGSGEK